MQAREVRRRERHVADRETVAGQQVDDTRRQASSLEQLQRQLRGETLRGGGFPEHDVAHQRRCRRQIARNRGEVEGRDGVDEPLERAVVEPVPDAGGIERGLLGQDPAGEGDVEAPEVGELAGRVDLCLVGRLGLPEHRRRVEPCAPRAAQQVGGAQQDPGPVVEGQLPPGRRGCHRRVDRLPSVGVVGARAAGQEQLVAVRCPDLEGRPSAGAPLAADAGLQVGRLGSQCGQLGVERGTLGRAGAVAEHRLVARRGNGGDGVHRGLLSCGGSGRARKTPGSQGVRRAAA